jgi:hypothetical protein
MPDEYLPPNKILFLQNLPQDVTQAALMELFSQYVPLSIAAQSCSTDEMGNRYPNLLEVRMIPTKKDIAFVEYTDAESAGVAKDALHNYKLDGEQKIKVNTEVSIFIDDFAINFLPHFPQTDNVCQKVISFLVFPRCIVSIYLLSNATRGLFTADIPRPHRLLWSVLEGSLFKPSELAG